MTDVLTRPDDSVIRSPGNAGWSAQIKTQRGAGWQTLMLAVDI